MHCSERLKSGYMGCARIESSVDATPAVMLSPAVAMAAELPLAVADSDPSCHGNRRAQHNYRGGTTEDSNQANSI